ncbi:MAG: GNAT family protein [Coriobacteriia bacterium]|nr:GNAT family protein [Coriobacteriia bacterium]
MTSPRESAAIRLRPAAESDRAEVYRWLAHSDVTRSMLGPPVFPELPAPTWDEFCADYAPYFFTGARPDLGRSFIVEAGGEAVGQVNYAIAASASPATAELDIWMRSEADTGQGWGPAALRALVDDLRATLGITEFVIRPSARNPRAVRAYEKAGFERRTISEADQAELWGAGDYADTVVLRMCRP